MFEIVVAGSFSKAASAAPYLKSTVSGFTEFRNVSNVPPKGANADASCKPDIASGFLPVRAS